MGTPNVKIVLPPPAKTMAQSFEEYLRVAYKGQPVVGGQYVHLKRAFFAGMWGMLNSRLVGPVETADLHREYMAYLADVSAGKA